MIRVVSGVLLAAVFFSLIWFASTTVLLAVALGVASLAVHEYTNLFRALDAQVPLVPALAATWAATILVPFNFLPLEIVIPIGLIVIAVWVMARLKPGPTFGNTSVGPGFSPAVHSICAAALAPIYIGLPLGALVAIHQHGGRGAVILLIATVVVSDSAQYYAGRTFGRRPLAPTLSPKKTIEGAIGGLVMAPVFLAGAASFFVPAATNRVALAVLGVTIVVVGIAGDLFESMLKRAAGMKDSSALIPGHGGALDRIDALLFAAPVYYLFLRVISA